MNQPKHEAGSHIIVIIACNARKNLLIAYRLEVVGGCTVPLGLDLMRLFIFSLSRADSTECLADGADAPYKLHPLSL